jgi:hypothetical protein
MIDFQAGQVRHRQNIERYCMLLATELTDLERADLHKRIAEERAQLERSEKSQAEQQADIVMAADAHGQCRAFFERAGPGSSSSQPGSR